MEYEKFIQSKLSKIEDSGFQVDARRRDGARREAYEQQAQG